MKNETENNDNKRNEKKKKKNVLVLQKWISHQTKENIHLSIEIQFVHFYYFWLLLCQLFCQFQNLVHNISGGEIICKFSFFILS